MNSKNFFYVLACISYCLIIGTGIYEHFAVWPVAFSEPPKSLTMFQGDYALQSESFWKLVHPVTLVLLLTTLGLNWKTARKKHILITLVTYITALIVTFIYYVPELKSIIGTSFTSTIDAAIQARGSLWITLSKIRLSFIFVSAFVLILGLTKPEYK
ncbi:MAG: hypothetical protein LC111_12325 [Bacteroidia bacterium]|nr:hypothetical protein [Bacteroidia bacterium]